MWTGSRSGFSLRCRSGSGFPKWRGSGSATLPFHAHLLKQLQDAELLLDTGTIWLFSSSVADPDPGSSAFLTPGSGIGFFRIPGLGSRILNPYFWELSDNFLSKKVYNSLIMAQIFCEIYGYKKSCDNKLFFTPLFCCRFWIRDPRSGIWDPGSGINIPDPQHLFQG